MISPIGSHMSRDLERRISEHIERCERNLERADIPGALVEARAAYSLAHDHADELPRDIFIESCLSMASALIEADAPNEALAICEEVEEIDASDLELRFYKGLALFQLVRFGEASSEFQRCADEEEDWAVNALWHQAVIAEFDGDNEEAERLYRAAYDLEPERALLPVRLTADEMQSILADAIEALPEVLRQALDTVVIEIDALPSRDLLFSEDPPFSPLILGLYQGTPWGEKSVIDQPRDVDRILIFQRSIERIAEDREGLHEQLLITLHHEIGHHLGWDEDDLTERGLD